MSDVNCIFCKIANKEITSSFIFETDEVFVIKDIAPRTKTHLLIIPKMHLINMKNLPLGNDTTICHDMFLAVSQIAAKLSGPKAFKIVCNNEKDAGQEVMHLHWHFMSDEEYN